MVADFYHPLARAGALGVLRRAGDESRRAAASTRDRNPNERSNRELRCPLWRGPAADEKLVEASATEIREDLRGRRGPRDRLHPCVAREWKRSRGRPSEQQLGRVSIVLPEHGPTSQRRDRDIDASEDV